MLRGLVVATQFLTRIPMPGRAVEAREIAPAMIWFPAVGALVAGATAAIVVFTQPRLGQSSIVLGLIFAALVTGGLHEDGLMDASDGLGGGYTRERALEIMKDSRIGSFGAIAIVLLYLARFTLFAQLGPKLLVILPATAALSRATSIVLMSWLPNARAQGLADDAGHGLSPVTVIAGLLLAIAMAAVLAPRSALLMVAIAAVFTGAAGLYFRKRLGGIVGDALGAVIVIAEVLMLGAVVAWR